MKRAFQLCSLLFSLVSGAQVTFNHGWEIWCEYQQNNLEQTADGGYIMCTDAIPEMDTLTQLTWCYLVKVNPLGNQQWIKRFPKSDYTTKAYDGNSVCQTTDGGYAVATVYYHNNPSSNYGNDTWIYVIKTDSLGNQLWSATYPGIGRSSAGCIHETSDHGLIVAGCTIDTTQMNQYYPYLLRLDSIGNVSWGKYYDDGVNGTALGIFNTANETNDGGFIATGYRSSGYGAIVKTDASGNISWSNCPTVSLSCYCNDIIPLASGGYLFCGADNNQPLLIRYDSQGTVAWEQNYSVATSSADIAYTVVPAGNGYTVSLMGYSASSNYRIHLMHTDSLGIPLWSMSYDDAYGSLPVDLEHTTDNGYAFISIGISPSSPWWLLELIKTDSLGQIPCHTTPVYDTANPVQTTSALTMTAYSSNPRTNFPTVLTVPFVYDTNYCPGVEGISDFRLQAEIDLYPNPASSEMVLSLSSLPNANIGIHLFNSLGEEMEISDAQPFRTDGSGTFTSHLSIASLSEGMYFLRITVDDELIDTRKVIVKR